jgi:hypothetical protein
MEVIMRIRRTILAPVILVIGTTGALAVGPVLAAAATPAAAPPSCSIKPAAATPAVAALPSCPIKPEMSVYGG